MVYRCNGLYMLPGRWRHQLEPVHSPRGVPVLSSDGRSSDWCPLMGHAAAVIAHALLGQCGQWLKPAPGPLDGCCPCLPLEPKMAQEFVQALFCCLSVYREKDAPALLPLLSLHPPLRQWCLASLVGLGIFQVHPKLSHSSLFSLTQATPVLSLGLTSKAQASASSPRPHQWTSGELKAAVLTICTGHSPLCPPQTSCCALLQGSKAPPLQADLSVHEGTS